MKKDNRYRIPDEILQSPRQALLNFCEKELINGEYLSLVCINCGMFYSDLGADTKNCIIASRCKNCFEQNFDEYEAKDKPNS